MQSHQGCEDAGLVSPHVTSLSDRDRAILDFEGQFHRLAARKEAIARERFGLSPTRYHQVIGALIDRPEALAYAPATVNRLRRLRDERAQRRSSRRGG